MTNADDLNDRTKLRASQQRKLEHACGVIEELIGLHMPDDLAEREVAELSMVKMRLMVLIRHQHVKDREVAEARITDELEGY
jgi:hypothetical protein